MRPREPSFVAAAAVLLAAALACGALAAGGSDPPDSELNPLSGAIEITDSVLQGQDYNVRHVRDPGDDQPLEVVTLTTDPRDDLGPRIVVSATGEAWVVWWRDDAVDAVLVRTRGAAGGPWSAERRVGEPDESSRHPEIAHDGTRAWVAYELDAAAGGTGVAVSRVEDEPDPLTARTVLATTGYAGDVDVRIHAAGGQLWVTWVDSAAEVGWREHDAAGGWGPPSFESYAADDVQAARARIKAAVLGP